MCINRSLVLVLLVPFVYSHHVCIIIHSLSTNYYLAINCPVFNGTSEHLSQMLEL